MLSGRHRTDRVTRHWTSSNPHGFCRLPGCEEEEGNLDHILLHCPALSLPRSKVISLISAFLVSRQELSPIIYNYTIVEDHHLIQFILDPTCLPLVITTNRSFIDTFKNCLYLSRTWCYSIHLSRSKIMNLGSNSQDWSRTFPASEQSLGT